MRMTAMTEQPEAPAPGVTRWRRKPVEVEALKWTGENAEAIREFTGAPGGWSLVPAGWYAVRGEDAYPVLIDPGDLAARYEPAGETGAPAGPAPPVAADLDELARLKTACRTLARVVTGQVRAMEAARIEMAHGDLYAASQWILNSLPDVWDDPETEWDGKESAAEWWDRTDGFYRAAVADSGPADPRSPAPAAAEPVALILGPSEGKSGGEGECREDFVRQYRVVVDEDGEIQMIGWCAEAIGCLFHSAYDQIQGVTLGELIDAAAEHEGEQGERAHAYVAEINGEEGADHAR
jgi:hypothetical protein